MPYFYQTLLFFISHSVFLPYTILIHIIIFPWLGHNPAGLHSSGFVGVVPVIVPDEPAGGHLAGFAQVIAVSVPLLPAGEAVALVIEQVPTGFDALPACAEVAAVL